MQVSFRVDWSWRVRNDKDEFCFDIDDGFIVKGTADFDTCGLVDISITEVFGDIAERTGLSWRHHERELPSWLLPHALAAAKAECADSTSALYEAIADDARDEYESLEA